MDALEIADYAKVGASGSAIAGRARISRRSRMRSMSIPERERLRWSMLARPPC
jgi:hypothetical protein